MKNSIPDWLLKSRSKWQFNGTSRPDFAIEPKHGQISVWDFPRPPALVPCNKTLQVFSNDILLVSSTLSLAVQETASPPTYYVPQKDIRLEQFIKVADKKSLCEWKGTSTYWALKTNPSFPVAWSYTKPFPPFEPLTDYLAFYPQHLECYLDGERVIPQPGGFYAGWITKDLVGPFKGEPGTGHW